MDKEQVAAELQKRGMNVEVVSGIVMLYYDPGKYEEQMEQFRMALLELNYHCSYGCKVFDKKYDERN